jgi:hypothetical protein
MTAVWLFVVRNGVSPATQQPALSLFLLKTRIITAGVLNWASTLRIQGTRHYNYFKA